jgi:Fe-S-cluster-containing dehydrogenase component
MPGAPAADDPSDAMPGATAASDPGIAPVSRRRFLGVGLALVAGTAGAAITSRFFPIFEATSPAPEPIVPAYDPEAVAWTFIVDTDRCIGCGLCVVACKEENDVPEEAAYNRTWVERHVVTGGGTVLIESPDGGIDGFATTASVAAEPRTAGNASAYFVPRLCMQCAESPCTTVCPVGATYQTPDGVILVDAARCIGCGYCVVACPYGARYIVPAGDRTPGGSAGVADKCTWCYHRLARGLQPACVEVCPVGARRFGDANDPSSEVAAILRRRSPQPLWPEYGTKPRVLYLGPVLEEA